MIQPAPDINRRIAARLRALRDERGLTLDALAHQAGVSRAMLSRIERGDSSPTAQLLNKVCGGLGLTLSALFAEAEAPAGPLLRRADQPVWRDPASGYVRRAVSPPGPGAPVDIAEIAFPPGATVGFDNRGPGGMDQHIWVLEGVLELELGTETYRLETGDCLRMRLDRPILFRNPSDRMVRYAVVITHGAGRP